MINLYLIFICFLILIVNEVYCDCSYVGTDDAYKPTCLSQYCYWCGIQTDGVWGYTCASNNFLTCEQVYDANTASNSPWNRTLGLPYAKRVLCHSTNYPI
ncbi:hypothetical protein M0811_10935 [Anaeramoeba ignava]|uniref:Uncharacterized protein n=1 Tax=Anaeramoeba ignava TaxID=1746090 RepID=A0A9Q0LFB7_ANAIG|nr:hypothetical protein M0811_10935 [Anaeramoeba ignava]